MRLLSKLLTSRAREPAKYTDRAGFVFILGMHRSGTSCLAGSLERCGLFLGQVARHGFQYNPRGTYELEEARQVHNQILCSSDGTWHQPPDHIKVSRRQRQVLRSIAAQLGRHQPCALKDPRLLLLLDVWTELVDSYTLIGTFRHPVAVAQSLTQRNLISAADAHSLWTKYNAALVRWHRAHRFPIIEFDLADVEAYCRTVAAAAIDLGLAPDMDLLQEFVDQELDHSPAMDAPVPTVCQNTYAYLKHHQYRPNDDR